MKTFKIFLEDCEPINEAEYNAEWWDSKSDSFKQRYIERHPNSIYAQKAKSVPAATEKKNQEKSSTSVKGVNSLLKDKSAASSDFETAATVLLDRPQQTDAWMRKVNALAEHPYTPDSVIRRMEKEQPYAALHSPKASKEFLDTQAKTLDPMKDYTWMDVLVQNPALDTSQRETIAMKLKKSIKDLSKMKTDPKTGEELEDWNKNWYKNRFLSQLDMLKDNK